MTGPSPKREGGLARYFVENRQVGWLLLLATLAWGVISYARLAQQEDPKIPERWAMLVTRFPGASALKVEELVTKKLEQKIAELASIEEIKSESRAGVSVITVALNFGSQAQVDQDWDQLRARLAEVELPEGCQKPWLNTDFGKTVTLLFALTSPPASDAECRARAALVKARLAQLRAKTGAAGRAAVVAFFPPDVPVAARTEAARRFVHYIESERIARELQLLGGASFVLAEFATRSSRADLERSVARFIRGQYGSDFELFPDLPWPLVLLGEEDPLDALRAQATPRYSYRQLEVLADGLKDDLKQLDSVGRVTELGIVPETVYLEFSMPQVAGYGLSSYRIINAIATRNAVIPGGVLRTEGQNFIVQLSGEFASERDLPGVVVGTSRDGQPIYLRDLFGVYRTYQNPIPYNVDVLARRAGALRRLRAVMLAVEMKDGQIIRDFNAKVAAAVGTYKARLPDGVEILTLSDQPKSVAQRIHQFMRCFLEAVVVVVLVALFLMDWRSAVIVAAAIPLTVALTFGGMRLLGVPLHQISIAALIIALGMLVDVPVVASDAINRELAHGQPRPAAAWLGPFRLRHAIAYATLINIVAFLPLALIPGDVGAFILALPVVVTLALGTSYLVSITFVPLLGYYMLRGQKSFEAGVAPRQFWLFGGVDRALAAALPRYRRLLQTALAHPWRVVAFGYGLMALSLLILPHLGRQFFPPAERNQLLVDVELPQTASINQTRAVCAEIVAALQKHEPIETAAVFMGGSAPRFYYNVRPWAPGEHEAQILINTRRAEDVPALVVKLRDELDRGIAGARLTVRQLEQGKPLDFPIQVRLSGPDLERLRGLADQAAQALRAAGGYKVHDDLGRQMPTLQLDIDQDRANTLGIDNLTVGRISQAAFAGLPVTQLREGDHLVPVLIRLRAEERSEAEKIRGLYAESPWQGKPIPFESFARLRLKPEFATIAHHDQLRTVTVRAFAPFGELASTVLARARPALDRLPLPPGYTLEYAGEARELQRSQREMTGVMALSLSLIALALVLQFRSVMKSVVVLLTVPLGLVGALTGLFLTRGNLGFMALLAIVSLAGVIISHIIVLSDFIEDARAQGRPLQEALVQAGLVRLRPVLVTVLATVGGLIPLGLTGGALWHPLTAVHIFGLLFATLLTLVLLPVLYYLFCARLRWIR
jgi:multidrug efflux pump subunit AcrB